MRLDLERHGHGRQLARHRWLDGLHWLGHRLRGLRGRRWRLRRGRRLTRWSHVHRLHVFIALGARRHQRKHVGLIARMRLDGGDDSRLRGWIAIQSEQALGDCGEGETRNAAPEAARPQRFLHVHEAQLRPRQLCFFRKAHVCNGLLVLGPRVSARAARARARTATGVSIAVAAVAARRAKARAQKSVKNFEIFLSNRERLAGASGGDERTHATRPRERPT